MKPLFLVDGIKCTARHDTAIALSNHYSCDLFVGGPRTTEEEYLGWMDVNQLSGVVIESSWQTQVVGQRVVPGSTGFTRDGFNRLSGMARYLSAITVHVTSFVDTTILCAAMEQHTGSLTAEQLSVLFRLHRQWEFPVFKTKPVVETNPHVDDFNDKLFPELDEQITLLGAELNALMDGY